MRKFARALLCVIALCLIGETADLVWLNHARATVSGSQTSVTLSGNGSTTVFPYSFIAAAATDITVTYTDANGVATTLSPSLYTLSINAAGGGQLWGIGGSVTYPLVGSPIASGTTLTITRNVPYLQTVSSNQGQSFAQAVEVALDLLDMQIQQIANISGLNLTGNISDPTGLTYNAPPVASRANKVMCWDGSGNVAACSTAPSGTISSAMAPVVSASSLANGRLAFGLGSMAVENVNGGSCGGASIQDDGSSGGANGVGYARVVLATAPDSTSQSVTCAFHLTQRIATGPITYTLPRANTLFNGFGFWIYAVSGGAITLSPNASDTINGSSSGTAVTLALGGTYFVSTNAQSSGTWYINGGSAAGTTGYTCTGADTAALNAIIASGAQSVTISGRCVVSTLSTLPINFTLAGQNRLHDCIVTSSATGNVVTMSSGDTIRDLCFDSSATRTSGAFVVATGSNVTLRTLYLANFYNAIEVNKVGTPGSACPSPNGNNPCSGLHASDIRMYGGTVAGNDCILIDGISGTSIPYNDVYLSNIFCSGNNTSAYLANGIEIQAAGEVHIDHLETEYCGANVGAGNADVLIDPNGTVATGHWVQWVEITGSLLDAGGAHGINIIATNGASVNAVQVDNSWIASNASGDAVIAQTDAGSNVVDLSVTNDHIINNANGVVYGAGAVIGNMTVSGNYIAGNTTTGFDVSTGATGFRLNNNVLTTNGIGASFPSATLGNTFALGNFIAGNTTNVSGSPTLTVNANNSVAIP